VDREFGEFPHPAVDLDRATMLLGDNAIADREAEPSTFAGGLGRGTKGWNNLSRISGAMPVPLSRTRTSTASPRSRAATFNVGRNSGAAASRCRLLVA
jgi:hypothetical protein